MTHNIFNRLSFEGVTEEIDALIDHVRRVGDVRGSMDFNAITAMPKWALCDIQPPKKMTPTYSAFKRERDTIHQEWWGVDTNARTSLKGVHTNMVEFITEAHAVPKLIRGLSRLFPEVNITYEYAKEIIGYQTGTSVIENGDVLYATVHPDESKEAVELASNLWHEGKVPDEIKWDTVEEKYIWTV